MVMIGPFHGIAHTPHCILTVGGALVDQHDLHFDALLAQVLRLGLDRFYFVQEPQTRRGARTDQFWRLFQLDANDADF